MIDSTLNTEQIILEAAEAEFFEKGYAGTKMMAIARRANVAHSMLHYYFRSKDNLFQTIFLKKAQTLFPLFENAIEQKLPFSETVLTLMKTQFHFLMQNPQLPHFLLTEILTNKENRALLLDVLSSKVVNPLTKLKEMFDEEVKKGAIRPISFQDLVMNIFSLNISTFLALPVVQDVITQNPEHIEKMLDERCESNIQFVLAALRP
jgi:AcrR family transcriptional regulator